MSQADSDSTGHTSTRSIGKFSRRDWRPGRYLKTFARLLETMTVKLAPLECYGPRGGVPRVECGHDRPFSEGENWVCPVCFAVPPGHEAQLSHDRTKGLAEMSAGHIEKTRDDYEREALQAKRRPRKNKRCQPAATAD